MSCLQISHGIARYRCNEGTPLLDRTEGDAGVFACSSVSLFPSRLCIICHFVCCFIADCCFACLNHCLAQFYRWLFLAITASNGSLHSHRAFLISFAPLSAVLFAVGLCAFFTTVHVCPISCVITAHRVFVSSGLLCIHHVSIFADLYEMPANSSLSHLHLVFRLLCCKSLSSYFACKTI